MAAVALCLAILIGGGFQSSPGFEIEHHEIRYTAIRLVLAIAAFATLAWRSRRVAIVGAVTALAMAAWLPERKYIVHAGANPEISLRPANYSDSDYAKGFSGSRRGILVPIAITHTPRDEKFHVSKVYVKILASKLELTGFIFPSSPESPDYWLALQFPPSQPKPSRFSIRGTALFDFYRPGKTIPLAEAKHCTSVTVEDRVSDKLLKIFCETPNQLQPALVTLRDPPSGQDWRAGLNSSRTYSPGPHEVWLSPLFRGQAFFHLTASDAVSPGSQWLVPAEVVPLAEVEITPEVTTGHALAEFNPAGISSTL